jgi:hypothetical protein
MKGVIAGHGVEGAAAERFPADGAGVGIVRVGGGLI